MNKKEVIDQMIWCRDEMKNTIGREDQYDNQYILDLGDYKHKLLKLFYALEYGANVLWVDFRIKERNYAG